MKAKHATKTFTAFTICDKMSKSTCSTEKFRISNADVAHVMGDVDDKSLKKKLETCKHSLFDSEIENGRHRVYNFAIDTLDPKYQLKRQKFVSDGLKCAAKPNVVFGFVLRNVEDEKCRYYFAHENKILEI